MAAESCKVGDVVPVAAYVMSGSARNMSRSENVHHSGVSPRRLPMTCINDELALRIMYLARM